MRLSNVNKCHSSTNLQTQNIVEVGSIGTMTVIAFIHLHGPTQSAAFYLESQTINQPPSHH